MSQRKGLVIGKFLPPHLGHKYLIDFAKECCDELTVLVCTLARQPISARLRLAWMRESFGDVCIVHHDRELPEEPQDAPSVDEFWDLWKRSILDCVGTAPDVVFASEAYGWKLAEVLGAEFMPVDLGREMIPVSGTALRADMAVQWDYLLPAARPHFVRRIAIVGPESSGKSSLARHLADRYHTKYVAEYGRLFLDAHPQTITAEVMTTIARGHRASEDAMTRQSRGILFCDTEAIVSKLWSRYFLGETPSEIERYVSEPRYQLYLVTSPVEEWKDDPQRHLPNLDDRKRFFDNCVAELDRLGRRYEVLDGDWSERRRQAAQAVDALLQAKA